MECPICKAPKVPDNLKSCPQCHSDIEAFRLADKIEKTSKSRLNFGIIASALFIIALAGWLITTGFSRSKGDDRQPITETDLVNLKADLKKLQHSNQSLLEENKSLKEKLVDKQAEQEKRKKEYVVQEGESLYTIARKVYGNGYKFVDLAKDNNISDPSKLMTGQKLIIYY